MDITGIGSIFDFGTNLINKIWPDANQSDKDKLMVLLAQLDAEVKNQQAQLVVAQTEATSESKFKSWARPFILWTCGAALCYSSIIDPLARFIARVCFDYQGDLPSLDITTTNQILMGMLGLGFGGMRTFEKTKGIAK